VFFRCSGESSVCGAIRSSMSDSLERNNLPAVRDAGRALILLSATVEVLQEGVNRDFGTTFATRTYSVEVTGESKDGRAISMPGPRTFSFDAQFGRERLEENSRLIARDVVERIREFWKKRTD
jgi:rRNA maturation protein Nop10